MNLFYDCDLYELINHGIKALAGTLPNEVSLNNKNLSIGVVGKDLPFRCFSESETEGYVDHEKTQRPSTGPGGDDDAPGPGSSLRNVPETPPNLPEPVPQVATMSMEQ